MRKDTSKKDFQVILCWDKDRFGRFDGYEEGHWIEPFRRAGIRLETYGQGRIDWESFEGRIVSFVTSEAKHAYLRDLSRNVCRGQLDQARKGKGTGENKIPYGYCVDRSLDDTGKLLDYWLVVEPVKAELVRRIFREYLDGGSIRGICASLNADKIPSPGERKWNCAGVDYILKNRKYLGTFVWGLRGSGSYHSTCGGEIHARKKHDRPERGTPIVRKGNHEAIIDQDTFDRVQTRLKRRQHATRPHTARFYILSGLLRCGDCGGSMCGLRTTGAASLRYQCRAYGHGGRTACYCNSISEPPMVAALVDKIQELYLSNEAINRLRNSIRKQQNRRGPDQKVVTALGQKISKIDRDIDRGSARVLTAPEGLVNHIYAKLEEAQAERDKLQSELDALKSQANDTAAADAEIQQCIKTLRKLRRSISKAAPEALAELLASFVDRIELSFDLTRRQARRCGHSSEKRRFTSGRN